MLAYKSSHMPKVYKIDLFVCLFQIDLIDVFKNYYVSCFIIKKLWLLDQTFLTAVAVTTVS